VLCDRTRSTIDGSVLAIIEQKFGVAVLLAVFAARVGLNFHDEWADRCCCTLVAASRVRGQSYHLLQHESLGTYARDLRKYESERRTLPTGKLFLRIVD